MPETSPQPLCVAYDVALLDLDGVVYVGPDAVPGAPERLADARREGLRLAFVTNNASRPPSAVADHLRELGVDADDADVVTSAQAAARLLSDQLGEGAVVFVIGGAGLDEALRERGLVSTRTRDDDPVAVVSGYSPDVRWGTVIEGAILVREGLPWVATNTDMTVPTPAGPGPGNGTLVGVVARFAERDPQVAGKPQPPLFEETLRRLGGARPLVVGDRLDTDIEGARKVGYDSLLVMTGVTDAEALVAAAPQERPTYVAAGLGALTRAQRDPDVHGAADQGAVEAASGRWVARVVDGRLEVSGPAEQTAEQAAEQAAGQAAGQAAEQADEQAAGQAAGQADEQAVESAGEDLDRWWQVVAAAGWAHLDALGRAPDVSELVVPASLGSPSEEQQ